MATKSTLHALMSQTADGMFKAEYPGELNPQGADAREFPDSHLGTSAREVKLWVEQMAKGLGYEGVVWERGADERGS